MNGQRSATELAAAAAAFGISFRDLSLLGLALAHPSAAQPRPGAPANYQRLEFLGDRVLGVVIADHLYRGFPAEEEGALARRFAALVSRPTLAKVARRIGLGRFLHLAPGEEAGGGRNNPANLADACEAVIGALYVDGGLEAAAAFIDREWAAHIAGQVAAPRDPKTTLQEWAQGRGLGLPAYRVVARCGPDHAPTFEVEARVEGVASEIATGGSKSAAEREAARRLLARLAARSAGGDGG